MDPRLSIALLAVVTSLISSIANRLLVPRESNRRKRVRMVARGLRDALMRSDAKRASKLFDELLQVQVEELRKGAKGMVVSLLAVGIALVWMRNAYTGLMIRLPFGLSISWFWWYFLVSILVSLLLKRLLV
jgi:uncharacterized membrane protein (DUF106 family)